MPDFGVDNIIVTIGGVLLMVFTWWFFLAKKEKEVIVSEISSTKGIPEVDIKVSGGYSPEVIAVPKGKTTRINFIRTDPSECLSEVVLGDFKIRKELPLNRKVSVEITPKEEGEYGYTCGMNMFHGKIVVRG
ncbi:MAG: cupredoxin domain-containing protein [Armatimonadetes bacterium]|nr:MAG: cupredoxin domain-containing protein [Armatimonadota bacterium]